MLTWAGPQIQFRLPEEALLLTRALPNLYPSPSLSSSLTTVLEGKLWLWVLSVPYLSYWSQNYQINCHFTKLEVVGGKRWSGFRFHGRVGKYFQVTSWFHSRVGKYFQVTSGVLNLLGKFWFLGCLVYGCERGGFMPGAHLGYKTKGGFMFLANLEPPYNVACSKSRLPWNRMPPFFK